MKHFVVVGLALLTSGCGGAEAATVKATPATLEVAIRQAGPGDTIYLAPGEYGNAGVGRRRTPLTLVSADPANPAIFRTFTVSESSDVTVENIVVNFTPDAKTVSWSCTVNIEESQNVSFLKSRVTGGPAVSGVEMTAKGTDRTDNVIGIPTGRGVCISSSQGVTVADNEVSKFHRGFVMNRVSKVILRHNDVHDMRTTAIVGSEVSDLLIEGNHLHDAHPWRWGETPAGDHADFLALWSNPNQKTPNARVSVIGNRFEQADGKDILGMWFEGKEAAPFTDAVIAKNVFLIANLQGILLWHTQGARIEQNIMRRVGDNPKQSPGILLRDGVTGVTMSNNTLNLIDDNSGGKNRQDHNQFTNKLIKPDEARALSIQ